MASTREQAAKAAADGESLLDNVADAAGDAADSLRAGYDRLQKDLERLRRQVSGMGGAASEEAQAKISAGIEALRAEIDSASANLSKHGSKTLSEAEKLVRERPITTVLVAFGIGLILAQLVRR